MMQTDYQPGCIASAWHHKQTTGSIKASDVFAEMETQNLAALLVARTRRATPNSVLRPIRLTPLTSLRHTESMFPLDAHNRPYVQLMNQNAITSDLIQEAVTRFFWHTGQYPEVILLSLPRYFAMEETHYALSGFSIPYDCEGLNDYDVLVR